MNNVEVCIVYMFVSFEYNINVYVTIIINIASDCSLTEVINVIV